MMTVSTACGDSISSRARGVSDRDITSSGRSCARPTVFLADTDRCDSLSYLIAIQLFVIARSRATKQSHAKLWSTGLLRLWPRNDHVMPDVLSAVIFDLNGVFMQSDRLSDRFREAFGVPEEEFWPALKGALASARPPTDRAYTMRCDRISNGGRSCSRVRHFSISGSPENGKSLR